MTLCTAQYRTTIYSLYFNIMFYIIRLYLLLLYNSIVKIQELRMQIRRLARHSQHTDSQIVSQESRDINHLLSSVILLPPPSSSRPLTEFCLLSIDPLRESLGVAVPVADQSNRAFNKIPAIITGLISLGLLIKMLHLLVRGYRLYVDFMRSMCAILKVRRVDDDSSC